MPNTLSPWAASAAAHFAETDLPEIFKLERSGFTFSAHLSADSLFIRAVWNGGGKVLFRTAYTPGSDLETLNLKEKDDKMIISLTSAMGKYEVQVNLPGAGAPILHYLVALKPAKDLLIPFWPRDIIIPGNGTDPENTAGKILAKQVGTRSGQLYFHLTRPKAGAVFYLQNLTALADYCQQTETSAGELVGGEWPELGLALPPTVKGKPLVAGKAVIISDAYVAFSNEVPADENAMARQYLQLMSEVYLQMPHPDTTYKHWPDILDKGLHDLISSPGCWTQVDGHHYFNAYVSDYATPPEIMVQLAVLLPLQDYVEWSGKQLEVMGKIRDGLPAFYNEQLGTIMRWHPKMADKMEGEEEQKEPLTMDSWYLHHPLLNLSRLALKGYADAKKLFLDSLEYCIKVAHHFNYQWPVFYKTDTLEVIKEETQPGKGGEKDVPGLYAIVMLQAWELTGEKRYLAEAEKSAQRLNGLGFELFYQANNTAFSAGAMLRLYKITKKQIYLQLSELCLANIFNNMRLWDCNYGHGKNFPSFFTLFPLSDAPYSAVYEEQEVFCALHDYLHHAQDVEIFAPARILIAEYIRYLVERAVHYYPTMLPKEMLQEQPKIGEIDPNLWIALEDLHDGWETSGQVGQEVYGAGNAFGILPRHYIRVHQDMMVYTDYPLTKKSVKSKNGISFQLAGDGRLGSRLMLIKTGRAKLPQVQITINNQPVKSKAVKGGHAEFFAPGDAKVKIEWKI